METVRIGFGMRFVAALVDAVVAAVLVWVPMLVLRSVSPMLASIVGGLLAMAYYSLEVFRAQSLGKMIFKYRITRPDGSPATRDQLVKRWGYKQVPQALGIVAALPMLGFVAILGGVAALAIVVGALMTLKPEKLAFHDKLFGTAVYGPKTVSVTMPKVADVLPPTAGATTEPAKAA